MAKFGPPEPFDFTHPAEWPVWRQRFSRFRVASKLNKETGEVQVNSLLYSMGMDAEPIYGSFVFPAASGLTMTLWWKSLRTFCTQTERHP